MKYSLGSEATGSGLRTGCGWDWMSFDEEYEGVVVGFLDIVLGLKKKEKKGGG